MDMVSLVDEDSWDRRELDDPSLDIAFFAFFHMIPCKRLVLTIPEGIWIRC
jgi:hypothetical protein